MYVSSLPHYAVVSPLQPCCTSDGELGRCAVHGIRITKLTPPPASLLVYLFGLLFTSNFVLIFIITILLLAADFYYLKNIAGRRLVGLRWWNEVDVSTGDSQWVFESADPATKVVNATDSRFFWLAMYAQPCLWVGLAVLAVVRFEFIWLTLVGTLFFLIYPISVGLGVVWVVWVVLTWGLGWWMGDEE